MNKATLGILCFWLVGCANQENSQNMDTDLVEISYEAMVDDVGGCSPKFSARTATNRAGLPLNDLYIMRGDARFTNANAQVIGQLPFQLKLDKEVTTLLNTAVSCESLSIEVTLEKCVYEYPSERNSCPPVAVVGSEAFAKIAFYDQTSI